MGGPGKPVAPAFGDPGTANKLTANKGTANKGTANKLTGTANKGTANKLTGTANKLTANKGTAPRSSATTYLFAATDLEFADVVVGDVVTKELWVVNAHLSSEAYLLATIDSPRPRVSDVAPFQLIDLPQRVRPSREGLVPGKIVFQPTQVGDYSATVTVTARWQDRSVPEQRVVIAVRGWSREEGQPTRAEVRAVATAAADKVRAEQERTRVRAAMQKRYEQETDAPYPQSKLNALTKAFKLAQLELARISDGQHSAIALVEGEAGAFRRRPPSSSAGLARAIALLALDVVGAGIAGRLGAKVVQHFATREVSVDPGRVFFRDPKTRRTEVAELLGPARRTEIPALLSDAGLAALDEMVQATVLGILLPDDGTATDAERGGPSAEKVQAGLEFFLAQREAVNDLKLSRASSLVQMEAWLWPFLRKEADAALMAIDVFRKQLAAEKTTAVAMQAASTRHAWMSFVSQHVLGSLTAGQLLDRGLRWPEGTGATVTDVARLAVPFKDGKPPPYDGVLDVYLAAELHRPEAPITVARLHMNGVTEAMLRNSLTSTHGGRRDGARFSELRVVMRIIPTAPTVLDFGVVVVRDEAGNVFSSDTTGATPQDRTWLARRAGRRTASAVAQHEGAVALVNDLLQIVVPLKVLGTTSAVSTDAA